MGINGAALSAIRERSGVSISRLAEASGVERTTIHKLESGARKGTPEQAKALAGALGVPILAILALDGVES